MSTDALIDLIVERVLARLNEQQRTKALRVREAKLADLRAFEEMHELPRAIPTRREREG
jgi:hypothetical protein